MKTFLKIMAAIAALLLVLVVGLNLYFTNERLQNLLVPYIEASVGRPVEVENMSATFFSTFPHPGVEVNKIYIPGNTEQDTLLTMDRLVAGVALFPLFRDEINITELQLDAPRFTYTIYADSSTNLDFMATDGDTEPPSSDSYNIDIPYFRVSSGDLGYRDFTTNTTVRFESTSGDLSLTYADSIQSTIDVNIGGLHATVDSVNYLNGLPVHLTQKSTLHSESERLSIQEGTFAIRGLAMDLNGSLSSWSQTLTVDLTFSSSSDNFGDLLRLVPESYSESIENFESRGSLDLGGIIRGPVTNDSIPRFDVRINVQDGYLKDPDLPQPVEDIQIAANATNELITIKTFNAIAGANTLHGSGTVNEPLEDSGTFAMDFVADLDLATVHQFYDITELNIERLDGQLNLDARAEGPLEEPEDVAFDGKAVLADGMLKYQEVPKAIQNINIDAAGTQELFTIRSLSLQAAENSLSADGQIQNLLDESNRYIAMDTNLRFDLATIKDFYPIDEDTLQMEGMLTAQATLDGRADQIEQAVQSGSINLKNGYVDYQKFDKPFRSITFESVLEGPRMTIVEGSMQSGDNSVQATGVINNYLSEDRTLNLKTRGNARLREISNYYDLAPDVRELTGNADFNLNVEGPANNPAAMAFSGKLTVADASMDGESLREPVSELNGTFSLTPQKATLNKLTFNMGSSDINLSGSLSSYMEYLKDEEDRTTTPRLTGQYRGNYLDLDELIDWSDTTSTFNLELPDLNGDFSAQIDRMKITGVTMQSLQARATSTPSQINLTQASVTLFEGEAEGTMVWEIPDDRPSTFNFKGSLDSLRLESFFEEYPILGRDSQFYKFITGTFSSDVEYTTEIDSELNPLLPTTLLDGTMGMSKARIHNHPLQQSMADFVKINALRDIALDQWKSAISVKNNVLTISDLTLTSSDLGMELNGTQHLQTDKINFHVSLILPGRYKENIAPVITSQAANALTRKNGTIMVPLQITGTYENPSVRPDQSVIKPIVREYLKNKAGNTIRDLFGRGQKDSPADTAAADTSSGN
ncbi:AsmA family protein [Fodinibius sediminis]|uniref:AsmA domain-containing protein n=1 Tax=Fodinibius sediminis TaxID=1214077 RepID=A0A521BWZ6_9BACT|nr:AsmA-like C-terminal region-containing protein [Fodinibius sediminis]SMO51698.1 Protein of unknown function [Fodinibius sediminis]